MCSWSSQIVQIYIMACQFIKQSVFAVPRPTVGLGCCKHAIRDILYMTHRMKLVLSPVPGMWWGPWWGKDVAEQGRNRNKEWDWWRLVLPYPVLCRVTKPVTRALKLALAFPREGEKVLFLKDIWQPQQMAGCSGSHFSTQQHQQGIGLDYTWLW